MGLLSKPVFRDPPPPRLQPELHEAVAEALRKRPGQWALVGTFGNYSEASTAVVRITRGTVEAYRPAGDFDATQRKERGDCNVYARFVGDGEGE